MPDAPTGARTVLAARRPPRVVSKFCASPVLQSASNQHYPLAPVAAMSRCPQQKAASSANGAQPQAAPWRCPALLLTDRGIWHAASLESGGWTVLISRLCAQPNPRGPLAAGLPHLQSGILPAFIPTSLMAFPCAPPAAELPVKAPPQTTVQLGNSWDGFYAGAHV